MAPAPARPNARRRRGPRGGRSRAEQLALALTIKALPGLTPLMRTIERILLRLASSGGAMPASPVLGELAGNHGRSSAFRALRRLEKCRRLRMEVDLPNRRRRAVFPSGACTGWGETRAGHSPFCRGGAPKPAAPIRLHKVAVEHLPGPALPPPAKPIIGPIGPAHRCQWPLWADGDKPSFVYCDQRSDGGTSWCGAHRALVFETSRPDFSRAGVAPVRTHLACAPMAGRRPAFA